MSVSTPVEDPQHVTLRVTLSRRERAKLCLSALQRESLLEMERAELESTLAPLRAELATLKGIALMAHPRVNAPTRQRAGLDALSIEVELQRRCAALEERQAPARAEVERMKAAARAGFEARDFPVEAKRDFLRGLMTFHVVREGRCARTPYHSRPLTILERNQSLFTELQPHL